MTRVLLVDDNDRQRKLSKVLLEDAGYSVESAANAAEALAATRANPADIIVSDVMMDEVDGFGLCRQLRDDTSIPHVPVVLVSAHYDDPAARRLAQSLGASALIRRTPDFSAEMAGILSSLHGAPPVQPRTRRESYEAHLEINARQLARLVEDAQRSEARWRAIFDQTHETLTLITPDGLIVEANKRWEVVLGIDPAAMIGRHITEFAVPGAEVVVPLRHANGTTVHVQFSGGLIDLEGSDHVLTVGRDITAQLETERRMRIAEAERQELAERLSHGQRLEMIGQLTGSIAHDFNNVLSVILCSAEFLLEGLAAGDPRRSDADEIYEASKRAAALTKRLLAFSRKQVFELVDVEFASVVESISQMLRRLVGARIDLQVDVACCLGMVRADLVQLEQVIVNLAVNARDAMPHGGKLVIHASSVDLEQSATLPDGPYVVLSVTDTGCGMSKETMNRLFEPFFTTKERGYGTGLGLSTSFGIVKQLGGEIVATSELGKGTTMKVYLPRSS